MSVLHWRLVAATCVIVFAAGCVSPGTGRFSDSSQTAQRLKPPAPYEIRLASRVFVPPDKRPDWPQLRRAADMRSIHVVVQLKSIPGLDTRAALAEAGLVLGQPLTGNGYLATLRADVDHTAKALAQVRWAEVYRAEDKLSPSLKRKGELAWATREAGVIALLVTLFDDSDMNRAIADIKALGASITEAAPAAHVLAISLPDGREGDLAALDAVRYIEPAVAPGGPESDAARGFIGADVGNIPAGRPNGTGVVVGVMEGGHSSLTHADFGTRVTQGDGGAFAAERHPTWTTGMIAGSGAQSVANGATSANQWRGVAPNATVRTYNYMNGGDSITNYINDVTDAVQNDGVQLMNNSWGDFGCAAPNVYGAYVGRAPFLDGVVNGSLGRPVPIVFSAGNERSGYYDASTDSTSLSCITDTAAPFANYTTLNHPKAAKNIIAVGAVDSGNSLITVYSSWGPTLDGRIKPEVVAGGHHNGTIDSNVSSWTVGNQGYTVPGRDYPYVLFGLTSSAAAEVSGGLALMIDGWHRAFPGRADPLPSTLRAALVNNATDLSSGTSWFNVGPDYASGYGVVQVNDSVQSLERGDAVEGSVAHAGEAHYSVTVPAGAGPLRITLAWDDAPAVSGASPALVNDLDLVVQGPGGGRHYPWTLNPASPSAAAVRTGEDHLNNLEQVQVDAPAAGTWSVTVRGTSVASGRQNFSLVTPNGFSRQPVDLMLALDTSDSMNSVAAPGALTKIEILRRSARLLLETWNLHALPADRVGLAAFNSNVTTTPPTLPALQPFQANFAAVRTAVGGLSASGCTALGGALQTAFDSYDPTSGNKRALLVVTDGMQSTNPFVGEAGSPSRLRIQDFPTAGATLPFGAFFCTTTTANGPAGTPIVPDGTDVDTHGVEIHAIGVGVNGVGFQQLVQRLASENNGVHHLTTTPDSDLDVLYTNDLVRALKSTTLEIITSKAGGLGVGASKEIGFPVNATTRSVTVVLSWSGVDQGSAVRAVMQGPGGAVLTPAEVRQAPYFTVLKFDLGVDPAARAGDWKLRLTRDRAPALAYQLSVIADETCFHYDVTAPASVALGEPLRLAAQVSAGGRPAGQMQVQARVTSPVYSLGNLLAAEVPRTRAARKYLAAIEAGRFEKLPGAGTVLEAALAELARSKTFMAKLRKTRTREVKFEQTQHKWLKPALLGQVAYVANAGRVEHMGVHQVTWQLAGNSACGPVQRQEVSSVSVGFAAADPGRSELKVIPGPRGTLLARFKPVDRFGNLLGPAQAASVQIALKGAEPASGVVDLLDGTYLRSFVVKGERKDGLAVEAGVGGHGWKTEVGVPQLKR